METFHMVEIIVLVISLLTGIGLSFDAGRQYQHKKDYDAQNCELAFDELDMSIALQTPIKLAPPPPDPEKEILTGE